MRVRVEKKPSSVRSLKNTALWLFDLDNTLYDAADGVFHEIHRRMAAFIAERLRVSSEEAIRIQHAYWREYGATFLGLYRQCGINPEEFFHATHDFDLTNLVIPVLAAPRARALLSALPEFGIRLRRCFLPSRCGLPARGTASRTKGCFLEFWRTAVCRPRERP